MQQPERVGLYCAVYVRDCSSIATDAADCNCLNFAIFCQADGKIRSPPFSHARELKCKVNNAAVRSSGTALILRSFSNFCGDVAVANISLIDF